jgi:hypothetical protein
MVFTKSDVFFLINLSKNRFLSDVINSMKAKKFQNNFASSQKIAKAKFLKYTTISLLLPFYIMIKNLYFSRFPYFILSSLSKAFCAILL